MSSSADRRASAQLTSFIEPLVMGCLELVAASRRQRAVFVLRCTAVTSSLIPPPLLRLNDMLMQNKLLPFWSVALSCTT